MPLPRPDDGSALTFDSGSGTTPSVFSHRDSPNHYGVETTKSGQPTCLPDSETGTRFRLRELTLIRRPASEVTSQEMGRIQLVNTPQKRSRFRISRTYWFRFWGPKTKSRYTTRAMQSQRATGYKAKAIRRRCRLPPESPPPTGTRNRQIHRYLSCPSQFSPTDKCPVPSKRLKMSVVQSDPVASSASRKPGCSADGNSLFDGFWIRGAVHASATRACIP